MGLFIRCSFVTLFRNLCNVTPALLILNCQLRDPFFLYSCVGFGSGSVFAGSEIGGLVKTHEDLFFTKILDKALVKF